MDDSNINKLISGVHNGYIYDEELNRFLLHVELINKSNNPDPEFKTSGAAGMDIRANITSDFINEISGNLVHSDNSIFLPSGSFLAIPTGIYMKVPESYEIQVRPRSGLAFKHGVTVLNSPGTIDCVPKGTEISTPNGPIKVEDLFNKEESVEVYSYNELNNTIESDYVTDMWLVDNLNLIEIVTESGDSIKIPETKEVYTKDGWKMAINLTEDDEILKL